MHGAALQMLQILFKNGDFKTTGNAMDQITFKKFNLWSQGQKINSRF